MKVFHITRNERTWGIDVFGDVGFTHAESEVEAAKNLGLEARDPQKYSSYFIPPRTDGQTMLFINETREISSPQDLIRVMQEKWRG